MLIVFKDTIFSGLEIHGPAPFPIMFFAGEAIKNVTSNTVFQATNLVTLVGNGFEDFRRTTAKTDLLLVPHGEV